MVFVSYARADGTPFVDRLVRRLESLDPPCEVWIDKDDPQDDSFTTRISQALLGCNAVLYVMTSLAETRVWCDRELLLAAELRRPILPLRVHTDAQHPPVLQGRDPIDFRGDDEAAWRELLRRLALLRAPTEEIRRLQEEIDGLERETADDTGGLRLRVQARIGRLRTRVQAARRRLEDPQERQRVRAGVDRAVPERAGRGVLYDDEGPVRIIGTLPPKPLTALHDRFTDTEELVARLGDPRIPLVTMIGDTGAGKTAMIFKLLEAARQPPAELAFTSMVYLSTRALRPVDVDTVMQHLAEVPGEPAAGERLGRIVADRASGWLQRLRKLLDELRGVKILLVIDCAEGLVDKGAARLRDTQLAQLFTELATRCRGDVKILLFAASPVPSLRGLPPGANRYTIGAGLQYPYSMDFFLELDRTREGELTDEVRRALHGRTGGNPRLLELVFAVLQGEPALTIPALLRELPAGKPHRLTEPLVIRAMSSLDLWTWRTLVALAVYGRPVHADAVNVLLAPYIDGYDSTADLQELHERRLVRCEGAHYFVPPGAERTCVIESAPAGDDGARRRTRFDRRTLCAGAADYFARSSEDVEHPADLGPELAQISLRLEAGQHRKAFKVIGRIDQGVLAGWGLSGTLVDWREALIGHLTGADAAYNFSGLANAYIQLGRLGRAAAQVEQAARLMDALGDDQNLINLKIQMAEVLLRRFRLSEALQQYQEARQAAERGQYRTSLAKAIEGAGVCLAELGRLADAAECYREALTTQRAAHDADPL